MNILALIAAFGGGVLGAYMGPVPAFIMTGVFALVGGVAVAAGAAGDIVVNYLAFGSFTGPHIAFAGGVAAAAYAHNKGKLANGADTLTPLYGLNSPDVLVVGGIFGVLGFLIHYCYSCLPVIGAAGSAATDLPGITVCTLGIISRLVFGKTGLTGKYTGTTPREYISKGAAFGNNVILGLGIGILVSYIAAVLKTSGFDAAFGIFPIICFGFAAITLIFAQAGFAMPATHQIFLPAALAACVGINAFGPTGALLGVLFGVIASLFGDFVGKTFNSYCDSHIDPPATTIFILTIIINAIASSLA